MTDIKERLCLAKEILHLRDNYTQEDIKAAYHRLAKEYHPDNQETGNAEHFLTISMAYNDLMNSQYTDIVEDEKLCFVPDIFVNLNMTLSEAFEGRTIKVKGNDRRERLIKIPAGVRSRQTIVEPKAGNKTVSGKIGDVIVTVYLEKKDNFSFEPSNGRLIQDINIDIIKAITGGKESVTGIDGKLLKFDIPQGFQDGYQFIIQEKGWKKINSDIREDLVVRLHIRNRHIELTDKEIRQLKKIGSK